ncbi:hypothetical protein [Bradyrhizobium sp. Arg816]|uniref:hypothetical protein n=1 Tax=Bradyrhizobium sp. Arg816 TaxID=2998491 RepID=UPI00249E6012|nr:hypothetical protein [Bradyrhizobium sp. Arg816]MDI3564047.1 hypothetical protein [Bradyrhizobium sp. Arg816]
MEMIPRGTALLVFSPSVNPLTRDLPGPGIEYQARRLAGLIVQEGKARILTRSGHSDGMKRMLAMGSDAYALRAAD